MANRNIGATEDKQKEFGQKDAKRTEIGHTKQGQSENKMGVMPVNRLLISMSLPMMISMLVQALYNIVDSISKLYITCR